jgi:diguanylate cyclase (GGDEF)-like protein
VNQIKELKILDSGYAFLTDRKGKIVYHPQLSHGTLLGDVSEEMKTAGKSSDTRLIRYTNSGVEKEAAWNTLSNGLILFVSAPVSEISAGWRNLSWLTLATAVATVALFIILTLSLVRKITNPLVQLVHASQQISEGNYNVDLNYEGDDEIGILTKSFQQMVSHMRVFINDLNSKAFRDALTGVRNKGAFDIFLMDKNENIRQSDPKDVEDFAVVMFDCNELKTINDNYGHEKGDLYLQNACRIICKVYSHSPVFRIGGDEFVAILQNEDWKKQAELEQQFEQAMADTNAAAANPWDRVNVAIGTANYNPETDPDMESVFRRADVLMYENKKHMKEANTKWMEQ